MRTTNRTGALIGLTDAALIERLRADGILKHPVVLELVERFEAAEADTYLDEWAATPLTANKGRETVNDAIDHFAGLPFVGGMLSEFQP